ncbi:MAG: glycosyltransferase [Aulosira sp. ZfuVER01]|nr:glycosyltransferase [Aulosira sp. ZfuVER01]MDZ7998927.1 glycosyltransferase [Aulosira sp. DedVER01a]MDZ8053667.1 glycosyltransferase [Aulosira sp. ZfuCHP01]
MKIVQFSTWNVPCGIAGYTKGLVQGMLDNGITCEVIPLEEKKTKYMTREEIKNYFQYCSQQLIKYDVIHIQHEFSFFAGSYGYNESIINFNFFLQELLKSNKRVFVTFHTEPSFLHDPFPGIMGMLKKGVKNFKWKYYITPLFNSKNALNAVVHTKKTRRIFIDSGFKDKSINLIKQGVTLSDNQNIDFQDRNALKEKLGFPENAVVLLMFGFISAYKGYNTALNALKSLPENYYLLIIGEPHPNSKDTALDKIVGFINKHKSLKERVRLTGYLELDQLRKYQYVTDFCLVPYAPDTILSSSASITWALSSGKPVIASKIASFEELNEDNDCLHLFTPGCAEELAYKIQKLYENQELIQQLITNGLTYCQNNQWSKIAKSHIELYEQ